MTLIIVPLVYIIINLIDAYTDRKRVVKHKRGAYIYGAVCFIVAWPLLGLTSASLLDVISLPLLTRLAIFDIVRNLFAGKNWLYEGDKNKPDKSWFDQLEEKLNVSIFWLRIFYIVKYLSYLIFIYA